MDPSNLRSQSSSYVGLLHSQQVHNNLKTHLVETPVKTPAARVVRRKWNPADDEVLISAWLNTSKDAIVANE
uniref:Uncharacterized protein n=1 Tax=Brassica oleracea var. oleracea TaxID=109376 RepID=A0A0D3E4H2_BRAOL